MKNFDLTENETAKDNARLAAAAGMKEETPVRKVNTAPKIPYDQRKVQIVTGIMAAFAMHHYSFDVDIKIGLGAVDLKVTDFRNGPQAVANDFIDVWSLPIDQTAYTFGYNAAMRCICKIEHAAGRCV